MNAILHRRISYIGKCQSKAWLTEPTENNRE